MLTELKSEPGIPLAAEDILLITTGEGRIAHQFFDDQLDRLGAVVVGVDEDGDTGHVDHMVRQVEGDEGNRDTLGDIPRHDIAHGAGPDQTHAIPHEILFVFPISVAVRLCRNYAQ